MIKKITHEEVFSAVANIVRSLAIPGPIHVYGVPRGGVSIAYMMRSFSSDFIITNSPEQAKVIVDDIIDSGATKRRFEKEFPNARFMAAFERKPGDPFVQFPWEENEGAETDAIRRLLQIVGEDPTREGLLETPARVIKAWKYWTKGYTEDPKTILKEFNDGAENYDELIIESSIPVYSHCEHHLAAITGVAHVGYIPNGRIVGLSKLNRVVDCFARRLQVQERLTNQIASALDDNLHPKGVAVVIEARHMCVESRGVRHSGALTTTSAMRGVMLTNPSARAEFMRLIGK